MSSSWKKKNWWRNGLLLGLFILLANVPAFASTGPDKVIKIGIIGPMKFIYGQQTLWAAEIAAEEINESGGIDLGGVKHKIELVQADDNSLQSVVDAVSTMERLVTSDKVDLVVGGVRSEAVLAQQEVIADNKVLYLSTGVGSPETNARIAENYDRYKYFFRAGFSGLWTAHIGLITLEVAGNKIREELGIEKPKVAIMAEKLIWCDPMVKIMPGVIAKLGMDYVGTWRPSGMATDVRAELEAIESSGAHIMFQLFSGPAGIPTSQQWGELKIPVVPTGINVESGRWKHWEMTNGACEYQTFGSPYPLAEVTEKTIPFVNKFFKKHNDMPMWVAQSYDALYLIKEAIERTGTLNSDKLVVALEKTDYVGAQGRITFTPNDDKYPHEFQWRPDYLTWAAEQWQDGKQVVIWPNGKAAMGDKRFVGIRYKGSGEFKLPPWVIKYWKDKMK